MFSAKDRVEGVRRCPICETKFKPSQPWGWGECCSRHCAGIWANLYAPARPHEVNVMRSDSRIKMI